MYKIEATTYLQRNCTERSDAATKTLTFTVGQVAPLPWIEDFDQPAGTKQDTGSTAWTTRRTGTTAVFATDGNGSFQVNNGGGVGAWTSASIDISRAAAGVLPSSSGPLVDWKPIKTTCKCMRKWTMTWHS